MEKVIMFCDTEKLSKEDILKKIKQDFNLDSIQAIQDLEVLHYAGGIEQETSR